MCSTFLSKMMAEDFSRDKGTISEGKKFRTMTQSSKHPIPVGKYNQLYTV
jgi:hypothetical protein